MIEGKSAMACGEARSAGLRSSVRLNCLVRTGPARKLRKRKRPLTLDHQGSNASDSTQVTLLGCSLKASATASGRGSQHCPAAQRGRSTNRARSLLDPTQTRQLRSAHSREVEPKGNTAPTSKSLIRRAKRQKVDVAASAKAICTRRASSPKDALTNLARQGKPLQVRHLKPAAWS